MYFYTPVSHVPTISANETAECLYRCEVFTVPELRRRIRAPDKDIGGFIM